MTDILEIVALGLLGASGLLCVARVMRDGSIPDKVLGADTFVLVLIAAVAVAAGVTAESVFLDILVAVTLLAFIATITVARYVERRGARA
ncbi:MAG: monovalent cation/H+ antiporter complex subunit F [Acidimicrobiales bacterium]|jgi:multicomponent Na+:H+ antiporter subunit F|nr:monovalent cation/H+ antiporter complex subunit F [Acidimicrobiales bacterium]